jgi:PAS domain S-box-containing protein
VSPRRALPPALYRKFPFLQEVLDGMPASVKVIDSKFRVVYANRRTLEESGHDLPTLRGRPCHQYLNCFKDNCPWCPVVKALADGGCHVHYFEREKDGAMRRMEVTGYLLPVEKEGIYAVEITRDVTSLAKGEAFGGRPPVLNRANAPALGETVGQAEKTFLEEALRCNKGDMARVARQAGFSAKTLQRRLRKYGLDARQFKHIS